MEDILSEIGHTTYEDVLAADPNSIAYKLIGDGAHAQRWIKFFFFIAVLLMIWACWATMNAKRSRTAAAIAFVVLSWPIVGVVQDSLLYLRQGYGILIEKENAIKQIGRLLIVSALALMPLISVCLRPILRK